jgi:hypothetical protein
MTLLDSRERYGAAGSVGSMVTQLAPEAGGYVIAGATTVRRRSTSSRSSPSTLRTTCCKTLAASTCARGRSAGLKTAWSNEGRQDAASTERSCAVLL